MADQPKTSFIPKKPVQTSGKAMPIQSKKRKGRVVLSLISTLIFLITLAALGGVYFYKFAMQKKIENQVEDLRIVKDEFDEDFIKDATRLNTRIEQTNRLLDNHLSPSELFTVLEDHTLQTVSFSNFSFADTKDGMIQITGNGDAKLFQTIVLQSDEFGRSESMRNVIFTDLQQNLETGNIGFSFSAILDPKVVLYKKQFSDDYETNVNNE